MLITTETGTTSAAAPSALTATPPTSGASITLNWTAASGASNYRIERQGTEISSKLPSSKLQGQACDFAILHFSELDSLAAGSRHDPQSTTTRTLDGEGQQVKTVASTYNESSESWTTTTTYYVHSTVLGGQVLTELNESGAKHRTFVYTGNQVLATQEIIPYYGTQGVTWEHRDPSNASYRAAYVTGDLSQNKELDPTGADVTHAPLIFPNPPDDGDPSLLPYPSFSSPARPGVSYSVNGIPVTTDYFMTSFDFASHGSTLGFMEAAARPRLRNYEVSHVDGRRDFGHDLKGAEAMARRLGGTLIKNWIVSDTLFFTSLPQNPVTVPLTATQLKGLVQDRLDYGDCADYVNRLISQASKMAPPSNPANQFKDIPDLFDQIVAQPKGGFFFEAARGRVGIGSGAANGYIVRGDARITITPVSYYPNSPSYVIRSALENAPFRYGITGLHEVIHQAGKYWWDDDFLTEVAKKLEPDAKISDWDHALQNHCLPPNRRYNYDYTK